MESQSERKGITGEGQRKSACWLEWVGVEWLGKEGEAGGGGIGSGERGARFQKGHGSIRRA